jgi:hypothetical protein
MRKASSSKPSRKPRNGCNRPRELQSAVTVTDTHLRLKCRRTSSQINLDVGNGNDLRLQFSLPRAAAGERGPRVRAPVLGDSQGRVACRAWATWEGPAHLCTAHCELSARQYGNGHRRTEGSPFFSADSPKECDVQLSSEAFTVPTPPPVEPLYQPLPCLLQCVR